MEEADIDRRSANGSEGPKIDLIENGDHAHRYAGAQFTLAMLVTLVPDSYAGAVVAPGFERLVGTLVGMAVIEPVLLVWHLFAPARRGRPKAAAGKVDCRPEGSQNRCAQEAW